MNFNASGGRQPHKLGAKRLRQGVDVTPNTGSNYPPPFDPFAAPTAPMQGFDPGYSPNAYGPIPGQGMYMSQQQQQQQQHQQHNLQHQPPPPYTEQPPLPGFAISSQLLGNNSLVQNVALQYGGHLLGTGKEYMDKEIQKYVPLGKLKYYFAVDTAYVYKKLGLLIFPFTHKDWSMKYSADGPVQPMYEVNAPDLYVPAMAYLTYVLVAALALGTQDHFTPEVLGIQASSALAWTLVEMLIHLASIYVTAITTALTTIDILAYCGYKFVAINLAVLTSLVFHKPGYYLALLYLSLSMAFFMVRTLKMKILPISSTPGDPYSNHHEMQSGNKRRLYLLLFIAGVQPVLMWWLSYHLVPPSPSPPS